MSVQEKLIKLGNLEAFKSQCDDTYAPILHAHTDLGAVLAITPANLAQYGDANTMNCKLVVPKGVSHINFSGFTTLKIKSIAFTNNEAIPNGTRIILSGKYTINQGLGSSNEFSYYYYQHTNQDESGQTNYELNYCRYEAFEEFIYWNSTWYDRGYIDASRTRLAPSTSHVTVDDDGYINSLSPESGYVPVSLANELINQINILIGRVKTLEEYAYWEDEEAPKATSMSISGPSEITTPGTYTYDVTIEPDNAEVDLDITFTKKS